MSEVETLKQDLESFFLSVREYRNAFRREAPFTFTGPVTQAYQEMDKQVRGWLGRLIPHHTLPACLLPSVAHRPQ